MAERRLEELGRVVVVEPPVVDPPDVPDLADAADHLAERHALPEPLAQRRGDVVALHGLQVLDAVRLPQLLEPGEVERRAVLQAVRPGDLGGAVAHDLEPPGLGGEPGLREGLALEREGLGIAAAHVDEVARLGQDRPGRARTGALAPGETAVRAGRGSRRLAGQPGGQGRRRGHAEEAAPIQRVAHRRSSLPRAMGQARPRSRT